MFRKLGTCSACIRKAWIAAVFGSAASIIVLMMHRYELLLPSVAVAVGLLLLWVAHLLAFAKRITQSAARFSPALYNPNSLSRRSAAKLFARTLAFGVFLSVMPRSATAQAIGGCGHDVCDECSRPLYRNGEVFACEGCHSCTTSQYTCDDDNSDGFPNGC
jgi:MFS superfamily sulfate permease-like transporter